MSAYANKKGSKAIYQRITKQLILKYLNISYGIGKHLDRKEMKKLASMLYQADLEMTPGMFLSMTFMTAAITGIVIFLGAYLTLDYFMKTPLTLPLSILVAAASFGAVCVGFFFYLANKISAKKIDLEREMPFALSYMSIMSSAGSTPLKVIAQLSIQNYGYLSKELQKMGYRVYFLGEDAVTAINNLANNTPSLVFHDILVELGNIIHSGTGMMEFLDEKSGELIEVKKRTLKDFMNDLSMLAELYLMISMVNIMAVIGIPIVALFGMKFGFVTAEFLFLAFTYILLPFANLMFLAVLEVKYSSLP